MESELIAAPICRRRQRHAAAADVFWNAAAPQAAAAFLCGAAVPQHFSPNSTFLPQRAAEFLYIFKILPQSAADCRKFSENIMFLPQNAAKWLIFWTSCHTLPQGAAENPTIVLILPQAAANFEFFFPKTPKDDVVFFLYENNMLGRSCIQGPISIF